MTLLALGMDLLLASLLTAAVIVGVRLNGRLKGLRQGQGEFVAAVAELDAAAAKAERALCALKSASEEAHDALMARIETARALSRALETATAEAKTAARLSGTVERPTPAPQPAASPVFAEARAARETALGVGEPGGPQSSARPLPSRAFGRPAAGSSPAATDPRLAPLGERRRALEARFPPLAARASPPPRLGEAALARPSRSAAGRPGNGGEDDLFEDERRTDLFAGRVR